MRRTCERPACGQPVAVIYGQESATPDGVQQFWIDSWSPDLSDAVPPGGARGVLCSSHGEQLVPPRGWTLVDRRDDVPRLFKPRLVSDKSGINQQDTTRGFGVRRALGHAPRRISDVPRPQLFSDIERDVQGDVADVPVRVVSSANSQPVQDVPSTDGSESDSEMNGILTASGSLLRDAFRRANSIKPDATKELMRPTSVPHATSIDSDAQ